MNIDTRDDSATLVLPDDLDTLLVLWAALAARPETSNVRLKQMILAKEAELPSHPDIAACDLRHEIVRVLERVGAANKMSLHSMPPAAD